MREVTMSSNDDGSSSSARRGRRIGDSGTRQAILDVARSSFAKDGYAATTIRKVATGAGVDAALVMQFYRSKEELFAAVMSISSDTLSCISNAFDEPRQTLGERVTRSLLGLFEGPADSSEPLLAMLRASISNEHASAPLRDFIQARLLEVIAPKMHDQSDAAIRAGLASAMLVGIVIARRIIKVPLFANEDLEAIVQMVSPAIQVVLTE